MTGDDLQELLKLSLEELTRFTAKAGSPPGKYSPYLERLIAVCLCQGGAQHLIDVGSSERFDNEVLVTADEIKGEGLQVLPTGQVMSGVKDVDVVLFFEHHRPVSIPNRKHCLKSVRADLPHLGSRRIDFMKKTVRPEIRAKAEAREPFAMIRAYIKFTPQGRNYLSKKSVVGLYAENILGLGIWRTRRFAVGPRTVPN